MSTNKTICITKRLLTFKTSTETTASYKPTANAGSGILKLTRPRLDLSASCPVPELAYLRVVQIITTSSVSVITSYKC